MGLQGPVMGADHARRTTNWRCSRRESAHSGRHDPQFARGAYSGLIRPPIAAKTVH